MNERQLKVLWVAAALIVITILFPPWLDVTPTPEGGYGSSVGFRFIATPPAYVTTARIDLLRLILEWVAICAVAAVAFLAFSRVRVIGTTDRDE